MPELPEVETIRVGLQKLLPNRQIRSVNFDNPKSFPNDKYEVENFLVGAVVIDIRRRAKVLLLELSTNYTLVIHLKMTGQLVFRGEEAFGGGHPTDSLVGKLPDKSTRVTINFIDKSQLFFNDQRKFGWMRLIATQEVKNIDFMKKVGPEPLAKEFTYDIFATQIKKRKNSKIKAALLDQTVLAGVGNIYADESLFVAKIHPSSIVKYIPDDNIKILHSSIINVLNISILKGGSTDRNYVNAEGKKGNYIEFAKVFRKNGKPCKNCKAVIIKIKVAGRGTHVCDFCQIKYGLRDE